MRISKTLIAVTLCWSATVPCVAANLTPQLFLLSDPNNPMLDTIGDAITADGTTIVGEVRGLDAKVGNLTATRWHIGGSMEYLLTDDSRRSKATSVSDDGRLAAGWTDEYYVNQQAVAWDDTFGEIRFECDECSARLAIAVSGDGSTIVGFLSALPFYWTREEGTVSFASDLNIDVGYAYGVSQNGSIIVGQARSQDSRLFQAYAWDAEQGLTFLSSRSSRAFAVSRDGRTIVGSTSSNEGVLVWTVEDDGVVETLLGNVDGGLGYYAADVSDNGQVIVGEGYGGHDTGAFRWTAKSGMRRISSILDSLGILPDGMAIETAHGVSADGSIIVGTAQYSTGQYVAYAAVIPPSYVPEPSSILILITAILVAVPCVRLRS